MTPKKGKALVSWLREREEAIVERFRNGAADEFDDALFPQLAALA